MADEKRPQLLHTAIQTADIVQSVQFFCDVFELEVIKSKGPENAPDSVWLSSGLQLVSDPGFRGPEGRMAHIAFGVSDLNASREKLLKWNAREVKPNWYALADGLVLEIIAHEG